MGTVMTVQTGDVYNTIVVAVRMVTTGTPLPDSVDSMSRLLATMVQDGIIILPIINVKKQFLRNVPLDRQNILIHPQGIMPVMCLIYHTVTHQGISTVEIT